MMMKLIKKYSDLADKALAAGAQIDKITSLPAKDRFIKAKYEPTIDEELLAVEKDFDEQFKELGA